VKPTYALWADSLISTDIHIAPSPVVVLNMCAKHSVSQSVSRGISCVTLRTLLFCECTSPCKRNYFFFQEIKSNGADFIIINRFKDPVTKIHPVVAINAMVLGDFSFRISVAVRVGLLCKASVGYPVRMFESSTTPYSETGGIAPLIL
jgi:hypothetical protein